MEKGDDHATKILFWGIILLIVLLSFFVLKPFLIALASAFILAYLLKPVNDRLVKKMPKPAAALLSLSLIIVIVIIIATVIIGSLISQITEFLNKDLVNDIISNVENLPYENIIKDNLSAIISKTSSILLGLVSSSVNEIPGILVGIFITFFTAYYLLTDWDKIQNKIKDLLPFKNKHLIITKMEIVIDDVLMGTLLLALIEAAIAMIGFWIFGIKFAILLGFLIGIFAFVPALGPLLIWVPVAIFQFSIGDVNSAIGVTIVGLFLSTFVDSIVRIKLVGKKSNIHPAIMLVGIFGGIPLFGAIGFILGPLVLSILLTILENIPKIE